MVFFLFLVLTVHLALLIGGFITFIMIGVFSIVFPQVFFLQKISPGFSETPTTPILGLLKLLYLPVVLCSFFFLITGISFWMFSVVQGLVFPNLFLQCLVCRWLTDVIIFISKVCFYAIFVFHISNELFDHM